METVKSIEEKTVLTCNFFVQRKHRHCKAKPVAGRAYCVEHSHLETSTSMSTRKRIQCPLDPKHSVFEEKLEKHLKKCNSRAKARPAYHVTNFNSGGNDVAEDRFGVDLKDVNSEELFDVIAKVKTIHKVIDTKFEDFRGMCHRVVKEECVEGHGLGGTKGSRHLVQVGALLAMLESRGFLDGANTAFVEFGAGRGQLAHWVQLSLPAGANSCYVLVDRGNPRHKFDCKHKWGEGPMFHRLRLDIEHLDLSKVDVIPRGHKLICISKHLCGDATDLTLRCISNYDNEVLEKPTTETEEYPNPAESDVDGCSAEKRVRMQLNTRQSFAAVLVALCCHHRCSWEQFCGREALQKLDLSAWDFHLLTRMSTWATCGARDEDAASGDKKPSDHYLHPRFGKLSVSEREEIGRMCKRLIDYGRVKFLQQRFEHVALCYYVNENESLENVAIFAHH